MTTPAAPTATAARVFDPVDTVTITGGFWADWQRANREVTIPHAFDWLERDGVVDNLRRLVTGNENAPERRGLHFTDSDLYKALEGVAWEVGRLPGTELAELIDTYTAVIAAAQLPDGYLNSYVQAGLDERYANLAVSHELYCIGHLIQAAVAHHRATGGDALLDVAIAAADRIVADFGDGRRNDSDGHEEIETALVELYRETGTRQYLDLARQFLDDRGYGTLISPRQPDGAYFQDLVPVREQTEVVGHAVRAVYLLSGMVDVAVETGDERLLEAAIAQWEDMTYRKTYLNGALGSRFVSEAFGDAYELPPDLVYGETCATIGNIMLSWRLLLATGQSRFADLIERSLYNLFAASTSVGRDAFFYNNPAQRRTAQPAAGTRSARADAPGTRPQWFECACCPPNVMRTVASLQAYLATTDGAGVQLHQFMPCEVSVSLPAGAVRLDIVTRYPLDGVVDLTVRDSPGDSWALSLRIPEWAGDARIVVDGAELTARPDRHGYHVIDRAWTVGDTVRLLLPTQPRLTRAHPSADALRGTVAIECGPLVYCIESHDQEDGVDLERVELDVDAPLTERTVNLLGQETVVITASGVLRDDSAWSRTGWGPLTEEPSASGSPVELVAIPYHLWANRGPSTMRIFVPERRR